MLRLPKKPYTLAGFELGYYVPEADAMTTAPRRQDWLGYKLTYGVFYEI
jgi:hypothetical protein